MTRFLRRAPSSSSSVQSPTLRCARIITKRVGRPTSSNHKACTSERVCSPIAPRDAIRSRIRFSRSLRARAHFCELSRDKRPVQAHSHHTANVAQTRPHDPRIRATHCSKTCEYVLHVSCDFPRACSSSIYGRFSLRRTRHTRVCVTLRMNGGALDMYALYKTCANEREVALLRTCLCV